MVIATTQARADVPLPQRLTTLDSERMRAYRENLEFYEGRQWTESQRRPDRRLTFNYARTIIEKTASYTMSGLASVVDPADGSPAAAEAARRSEQALREVYDANALDQLDFDNEIDCCVHAGSEARFPITDCTLSVARNCCQSPTLLSKLLSEAPSGTGTNDGLSSPPSWGLLASRQGEKRLASSDELAKDSGGPARAARRRCPSPQYGLLHRYHEIEPFRIKISPISTHPASKPS